LYADRMTDSIRQAVAETERRRNLQLEYNRVHNITPKTIIKPIKEKEIDLRDTKHIPKKNIPKMITEAEKEMKDAADQLDFERAIFLRERIKEFKKRIAAGG
ncbi:MAG TPA: UvrB/UvrC motif-containing protein, partial [Candidatus Kapabacteria bacterium]|nr:UvrB/UvrC motif-containing protein [Candidatus Kapabacteria bacterium]